jgi:hypothetical protein
LSIEQVAARTKITPSILGAIERGDIAKLPPPVFTRGFLRAYAKEVHLDPQATAERYFAQFEPPPDEKPAPTEPSPRQTFRTFLARPRWVVRVDDDGPRTLLRAAGATAALIAVLIFAVTRPQPDAGRSSDAATNAAPAERTAGGAGGIPEAVATTGENGASAGSGPREVPLRVVLRADAVVWVTAHADGSRVVYRLLQPGDTETIDASREVIVRAGDAGHLTAAVNGAKEQRLGAAGQVATARFTPVPL